MCHPEIEARLNLSAGRFVARSGLVNGGDTETVRSELGIFAGSGKRGSTIFNLVGRLKPRQMRPISVAFRILVGEFRIMAKSIVVAAFLLAAAASVSAYGQDNSLVAPELSKPTPGQLLDQDYHTSTGA